ncbi:MAG: hypothetical protein KJ607_14360 [Bacteroidetes bacterium]|nr:hypothetical protein [Bacteroidota bacterium]
MKKLIIVLTMTIITGSAFAQFDGGGTFVGWQFSRTYLSNAYYSYSGDSATADNITPYKDNFWFNYIDFRYGNYSEEFLAELDGAFMIVGCVFIGYLVAEKEMWTKNGRLRKIDKRLGNTFSGRALDWTIWNVDLAFGNNGTLFGPHWDISAMGVTDIDKENDSHEIQPTKTWKNHMYNSLGLGVHVVNETFVASLKIDWLRAGQRNGFEVFPEVKMNFAKLGYIAVYYKLRHFGYYNDETINFHPKFTANSFGIRAGLWIADW